MQFIAARLEEPLLLRRMKSIYVPLTSYVAGFLSTADCMKDVPFACRRSENFDLQLFKPGNNARHTLMCTLIPVAGKLAGTNLIKTWRCDSPPTSR